MHSQAAIKLINIRFRGVAQAYIQISSSGIAIADDNQIVQVYIEKVYGEEPRLEITLYEPREDCSLY